MKQHISGRDVLMFIINLIRIEEERNTLTRVTLFFLSYHINIAPNHIHTFLLSGLTKYFSGKNRNVIFFSVLCDI